METSSSLQAWLKPWLTKPDFNLEAVAGDASLRSYYRLAGAQNITGKSLIFMDSSPEKNSLHSFIGLAQAWRQQQVLVPKILAYDFNLGWALLEDLGQQQLLQAVRTQPQQADVWYRQALKQLAHLQQLPASSAPDYTLPNYDLALLSRELELFDTWLVQDLLGLDASSVPAGWAEFQQKLLELALAQPQVCVHRDYHSRNLMLLPDATLGVIDFQDAVYGPCTYDAVSLIRDCYINWPAEQQLQWLAYFYQLIQPANPKVSWAEFMLWFDWMGMHRHLKAAGIFARLYLRDGKAAYVQDLPLTLQHLVQAMRGYAELQPLYTWLENLVIPKVQQWLQQHTVATRAAIQQA